MIVEGVKGVEKGLLGLVFTLQELDIVNQKDVNIPIFSLEERSSVVLNGINKVVGELFRGNVSDLDLGVKIQGVVADGVQKVSLAKPRTTINKQWVIGLRRGLGNRESSRVGKSVGPSGHEVIEVVFRVQTGIKQDPNGAGFPRVFLAL
ncbi:unannotated protein [freshwater metagenome]|uniref:Unannotated protein n=1 Tax=freshwater metagenome TaxID=449393 RepID=A0A6J6J691_9ZZZZ